MSINVTVTGNPVNIKKGKMVCYDRNNCKKEFEKRRLMRLEQVRQQSKEIAEDVRTKVRKQKTKHLSQLEKEGEEKLKKWQARKLLELQNQYKEAIKDIGSAHKEATILPSDSDIILEEKENNDRISRDRGKKAAEKSQIDKNDASFKKALPRQQRKLVREIENTRAALVSKLDKKGKSPFKKKKRKIEMSEDDRHDFSGYESDSEEDVPKLDIGNTSEASEECANCESYSIDLSTSTEDEEITNVPSESSKHKTSNIMHRKPPDDVYSKEKTKDPKKIQMMSQEQQTSSVLIQSAPLEDKSVQAFPTESLRTRFEIPLDTRISDRIKSRATMLNRSDFCDTINRGTTCLCDDFNRPPCFCKNKPTVADKSTSYSGIKLRTSGIDERNFVNHSTQPYQENGQDYTIHQDEQPFTAEKLNKERHNGSLAMADEIPTKPKIILQPSKEKTPSVSMNENKINYYDHDSRFSKEYTRNESVVEKIEDADLRVSPGVDGDIQYYDKVYKRDRDAQIRGQRALEKERIHKEYKELLKKLPALQRKERICEISSDKPEYHMSEERLQERERKRQNKMENAFEKTFPQRKPAVVTIPKKTHEKVDINLTPFKTSDSVEGSPILNLGEWDVESKPTKDDYKEHPNKNGERKEQLKLILESLQNQKKMLLEEIQSLPEDNNLYEILEKLSSGDLKKLERLPKSRPNNIPKKDSSQASKTIPEDLKRRKTFEGSDAETYETDEDRDKSHRGKETSKRKKGSIRSELFDTSIESSKVDYQINKEEKHKKRHEKCFISEPAISPTSTSPRKKAKMKKYKKRLLILQNCSTQTTPTEIKPPETLVTMKHKLKSDAVPSDKTSSKSDKALHKTKERSPENEKPTSSASIQDYGNENNTCPKKHIPCDCIHSNKTDFPEDFCKIIIKIRDDEKPEVVVSPPERSKHVEIVTGESKDEDTSNGALKETSSKKTNHEKPEKKAREKKKRIEPEESHLQKEKTTKASTHADDKTNPVIEVKENTDIKGSTKVNAKSWREQLSKNSSGETTSTSYYSPPDFLKIRTKLAAQPQAQSTLTESALPQTQTFSYNHLLKNKPQQHNIPDSSAATSNSGVTFESRKPPKQLDPKLLTYIKKLITMSRKNINDLGVSTASDISTPSQSIVDLDSNKPLNQLQNIMKYFNLNTADLQHHLSYSSDGSNAHFRTQENLTLSSVDGSQIYAQNSAASQSFSVNSKESGQVLQKSSESCTNRKLKKYAEIAENCNKRITNLTAMIQQVREEKMKILQSPTVSDPDQSTKYMKLPSEESRSNAQNGNSESSETSDQELQKNILKIDYDLAERLKKMTPEELKQYEQELYDQIDEDPKSSVSMSDSDKELFVRLQNLLQTSRNVVRFGKNEDKSSMKKSPLNDEIDELTLTDAPGVSEQVLDEKSKSSVDVSFVPLLLDIPKLPKLTLNPLQPDSSGMNHRRPPPSKGLSFAKRHNGDISSHIPHELSTIVEADSQISTKIEQSPSSKFNLYTPLKKLGKSKQVQEGMNDQSQIAPPEGSTKSSGNKSSEKSKSHEGSEDKNIPPALSESDQSLINMLNEINKSLNSSSGDDTRGTNDSSKKILKLSTSSSEKSDIDAVEKMLRSIGMDWAVTTLRKTNEALALSSSSSSVDFNVKASKTKSKSSKSSDVSLKEFLTQQIMTTISSSTLKSNASSPTDKLLGESQEYSSIHFSIENTQQRTSTPIQSSSKSMEKSQSPRKIFTGESDISSVKNNSKEIKKELLCYSLSEVSSNS